MKECRLDRFILDQQSLKEAAFVLIQIYLEGRLFKVEDVMEEEKAIQKYLVWSNNKAHFNQSFAS
jgi:ferric iron reductase protein FhuF